MRHLAAFRVLFRAPQAYTLFMFFNTSPSQPSRTLSSMRCVRWVLLCEEWGVLDEEGRLLVDEWEVLDEEGRLLVDEWRVLFEGFRVLLENGMT